jgi:hypothetical protein
MCRLTRIVSAAGLIGLSFAVVLIGQEPQGLPLGQLRIVATGLDTGLVAAAEMGPWLLQPGEQFIIGRLRATNVTKHWNCTTFIPRLQHTDGTEVAAEQTLVEPSQPVGLRGLSAAGRVDVRVVFRTNLNAKPSSVVLTQDTPAENQCRIEWGASYPRIDNAERVEFPLNGLPNRSDLTTGDDGQIAARLGELLIASSTVRIVPTILFRRAPDEAPRRGYRFIAADVIVTNVGRLPNCTGIEVRLNADENYTYAPRSATDPAEPRLNDLLPKERRSGTYVFEVEAALTPRWLTVRRVVATWPGCESRQGMFDTILKPETVRLPLSDIR